MHVAGVSILTIIIVLAWNRDRRGGSRGFPSKLEPTVKTQAPVLKVELTPQNNRDDKHKLQCSCSVVADCSNQL